MHEVGLVQEAIRRAVATADAADAQAIERLTFAIAPGGHVTVDAVEMLFTALSAGTPAEGAELAFEELEPEFGCYGCAHTFTTQDQAETCPRCGSTSISRLPVGDLVLRYVDVAEPMSDVHAGRGARTQPLHDELVRARRRAGFTCR